MGESQHDPVSKTPSRRLIARRPVVRLVASIGAAVLAVILLYLWQPGWFAAPSGAQPPPHNTPPPTPTPTPKPPALPYLGQERRVDSIAVTPITVTYTHGNGVQQANRGNIYAIVTLLFVNHSGHDWVLAPNVNCTLPLCTFYLADSLGEKNPPVAFDPFRTRLRAVILQDNGRQEGSVTFEVPERDVKAHSLQFLYYPNPVFDANSVKTWLLVPPPMHGS
jgi:hypothetical protein